MRFTIKAKLAAAFATVLILMAALVYVSVARFSEFNDQVEVLANDIAADAIVAQGGLGDLANVARQVRDMLFQDDVEKKREIRANADASFESLHKRIATLREGASPEDTAELDKLAAALDLYAAGVNEVAALSFENTNFRSERMTVTESNDAVDAAIGAAHAVTRAAEGAPAADLMRVRWLAARIEAGLRRASMDEKNIVITVDPVEIADFAGRANAGFEDVQAAMDELD
jgi:methyl-accepting chemotaxis protein